MRQIYSCFLLFLVSIPFLGCKSSSHGISQRNIRSSQDLIGLDFEEKYLKTMEGYLGRNKAGYDSKRKFTLAYETFPALQFDPHPQRFVFPEFEGKPTFTIPSDVVLPEDRGELAFFTFPQLASLIKTKKISSLELTQFFKAISVKMN